MLFVGEESVLKGDWPHLNWTSLVDGDFAKFRKKHTIFYWNIFHTVFIKKRTLVTLVVVWKKLNELWQCYLKLSYARYVNKNTGRHLQFTVKDKINWQIEAGLFWTTLNKLHIHKRSQKKYLKKLIKLSLNYTNFITRVHHICFESKWKILPCSRS